MTSKINNAAVAKLLYGKTYYPDMIPIYPELRYRAQMVAATARAKAGKKSGRLAASIDVTDSTAPPFTWFKIEAHTPYAYYHHRGTKPHIITGDLAFRRGGRVAHAKVVRHPGTKPNPFLREALVMFMRVHESGRFTALDRGMASRLH